MDTNVEVAEQPAQRLLLRDGRTLSYAEYGDRGGAPLLFFHGTPGSRVELRETDDAARRRKVHVVAPDRPGYGQSSPKLGRTIGEYSDDIVELAGHLGVERFAVAGVSGGGGYATACAARLPDRVTTAIVIAGMAPATKAVMAQMHAQNRTALRLARWAPWLLARMMGRMAAKVRDGGPEVFARLSKGLPPADVEIMRRPQVRATLLADLLESVRQGPDAAVAEMRLYTRPYDFALEDIAVPVHLFHGEADANVPIAIGRDVASRIPGCTATFIRGAGHLWFLDHLDDILPVVNAAADQ